MDVISIPKSTFTILNQLQEMEQKLKKQGDSAELGRNISRIRAVFQEGVPCGDELHVRLVYVDPTGEPYRETRTDVDAMITGESTDDLLITEVIKPIIRAIVREGVFRVVQKGVVIV